jgi:hypothetical protein
LASFAAQKKEITMKTALAALFLVASCAATNPSAPAGRGYAVSAPDTAFREYRTFSFGLTERPPVGYQRSARSLGVQRLMRPLIAATLEQKGYSSASDKPDLVVTFSSGTLDELVPRVINPYESVKDVIFTASIAVDVFDAATGLQVWHGTGSSQVDPKRVNGELLQRGVQELLAAFPSRSVASASVQ